MFIYLFTYIFIYLFIYLFTCLFTYLFTYLFIYSFIYLFVHLSIYLFIYLFIRLLFFNEWIPTALKLWQYSNFNSDNHHHDFFIIVGGCRNVTKISIETFNTKIETKIEKKSTVRSFPWTVQFFMRILFPIFLDTYSSDSLFITYRQICVFQNFDRGQ